MSFVFPNPQKKFGLNLVNAEQNKESEVKKQKGNYLCSSTKMKKYMNQAKRLNGTLEKNSETPRSINSRFNSEKNSSRLLKTGFSPMAEKEESKDIFLFESKNKDKNNCNTMEEQSRKYLSYFNLSKIRQIQPLNLRNKSNYNLITVLNNNIKLNIPKNRRNNVSNFSLQRKVLTLTDVKEMKGNELKMLQSKEYKNNHKDKQDILRIIQEIRGITQLSKINT